MTQQQLADLVHVSSRTIISIEKEQYSPSLMLAYYTMNARIDQEDSRYEAAAKSCAPER